jgi:hypothetical protein
MSSTTITTTLLELSSVTLVDIVSTRGRGQEDSRKGKRFEQHDYLIS